MAAKARLELRIDNDVALALRALADEIGVSVNQLMNGVSRWCVSNANAGKPYRIGPGIYDTIEYEGAVWFGKDGEPEPGVARTGGDGFIAFTLDFSDRRALIDGEGPSE